MGDLLGLDMETRELKIGKSFMEPDITAFHSIKYDFKPASVDPSKSATLEVANERQLTVTVPHSDGSQIVFKGQQRPATKDCVLVIDKITGEITLERITCNIQVKKTGNPKPSPSHGTLSQLTSSQSTSSQSSSSQGIGQRISSKTKVTSGNRKSDKPIIQLPPKKSPPQSGPGNLPSSGHTKKQRRKSQDRPLSQGILSSLPLIDEDEISGLQEAIKGCSQTSPIATQQRNNSKTTPKKSKISQTSQKTTPIQSIAIDSHQKKSPVAVDHQQRTDQKSTSEETVDSDVSSSGNSSTDSSSSSESEFETVEDNTEKENMQNNGGTNQKGPFESSGWLADDDLNLSDTGSDSD